MWRERTTANRDLMPDIKTYHADQEPAEGLQWARTRLLFQAYISYGPMHSSRNAFRIGHSVCSQYDVLWLEGEEMDDPHRIAAAWVERGHMKGREFWKALLRANWAADRYHWDYSDPSMEILTTPNSLLLPEEVRTILAQVWPQV